MTFRPALWMTVFAIPALAMLITLGSWQVSRMHWKAEIIDEFMTRATASPINPPAESTASEMQYQRLLVSGIWLHHAETHLTGRTFEGTAGYHVITPIRLDDGRILILNRGWVSQDYRRPETRPSSLEDGPVTLDAILRLPAQKGYFVPENHPQQEDWFTLNIPEITAHHDLGGQVIMAYSADVLRPEGNYVLPIGANLRIDIPNDHWHYALTWYSLALALIGIYTAWHLQTGRLILQKKNDS